MIIEQNENQTEELIVRGFATQSGVALYDFFSLANNICLNIDYDEILKFDVTEIVVGDASSPILGVGKLGFMVLA